jgi:hypothetical protein
VFPIATPLCSSRNRRSQSSFASAVLIRDLVLGIIPSLN